MNFLTDGGVNVMTLLDPGSVFLLDYYLETLFHTFEAYKCIDNKLTFDEYLEKNDISKGIKCFFNNTDNFTACSNILKNVAKTFGVEKVGLQDIGEFIRIAIDKSVEYKGKTFGEIEYLKDCCGNKCSSALIVLCSVFRDDNFQVCCPKIGIPKCEDGDYSLCLDKSWDQKYPFNIRCRWLEGQEECYDMCLQLIQILPIKSVLVEDSFVSLGLYVANKSSEFCKGKAEFLEGLKDAGSGKNLEVPCDCMCDGLENICDSPFSMTTYVRGKYEEEMRRAGHLEFMVSSIQKRVKSGYDFNVTCSE